MMGIGERVVEPDCTTTSFAWLDLPGSNALPARGSEPPQIGGDLLSLPLK